MENMPHASDPFSGTERQEVIINTIIGNYILPATTSVLLNQNVSSCKKAPTTAKREKEKGIVNSPERLRSAKNLPKMK